MFFTFGAGGVAAFLPALIADPADNWTGAVVVGGLHAEAAPSVVVRVSDSSDEPSLADSSEIESAGRSRRNCRVWERLSADESPFTTCSARS